MELITIAEWACLVVTLLMFSSGIPPCVEMVKSRNTRNVPFTMFLMGSIVSFCTLHYGLMLNNSTLIFINFVGAALQSIYTFLYISVVKSKSKPLSYLLATLVSFGVLYTYLYKILTQETDRMDTMGLVASSLTTLLMLLPCLELVDNLRNKNADGVPAIMMVGGVTCSCSWLMYGLLLHDANIYAPNIPGILIGVAKLAVIQAYGDTKTKSE